MDRLLSSLFKTKAFIFDESNTNINGVIEPFKVDISLLFGGQNERDNFQSFINNQLENEAKVNIPINLFEKIIDQYEHNALYKKAIDSIKDYIETHSDINSIDYISGGEAHDWYFSIILACLLGKPHISIFRDGTTIVSSSGFEHSDEISHLEANVMHISDIIEQGFNHTHLWFTAINNLGSNIAWSYSVFDMLEGGSEKILEYNLTPLSSLKPNESMFSRSLELGYITKEQFDILLNYSNQSGKNIQ